MKVKRWDLFVIFVGHEWNMVLGVIGGVEMGVIVGVGAVMMGGMVMRVERGANVAGVFRLIYGDVCDILQSISFLKIALTNFFELQYII